MTYTFSELNATGKQKQAYPCMIHKKLCIFADKMMQNLDFRIENNVNGSMYKSQNKRYNLPCNHTLSHWICLDTVTKNTSTLTWLFRIFLHPDYGP